MKLALTISMLGGVIALVVMTFGASYLHRALKQRKREEQSPAGAQRSFPTAGYESLPPPVPRASVTEGTTDLLEAQPELRRERLPVERGK